MNWKQKAMEKVVETPHVRINKEIIADESGNELEYWVEQRDDSVMVIPVRADKSEPTYILVRQHRYPMGGESLEFPAGLKEGNESIRDAAVRELKQETGYDPAHLKLIYSTFKNPGRTSAQMFVYLAVVGGAPSTEHLEEDEKQFGLKPVELTTKELHKEVLENSIVDQGTLSALAVLVFQSPKASEYLGAGQAPDKE